MADEAMKFVSPVEEQPDAHIIYSCIKSFTDSDLSGPHAPEGWVLSHLLNHCSTNNIPFTLSRMEDGYFFLKKGCDTDFVPEVIKDTLRS